MDEAKKQALAKYLGCEVDEIEVDGETFLSDSMEFFVLTDEEADDKEDEYLEQYIDDCILSELPEQYRFYFDSEKWKSDAKLDGRGHSLASYDGDENEEEVDGVTYYIYRLN